MIGSGCTVRVEYGRRMLAKFRAAARDAFPRETFAYLLGHALGDLYVIEDLWFPPDVAEHCTTAAVNVQDSWLIDAREHARDEDLQVIGDIHSHPRMFRHWRGFSREVTPSAGDHASGWGLGLCGICAVIQEIDGGLKTRLKFYAPILPVEEKQK
jgi:hypothetical protein